MKKTFIFIFVVLICIFTIGVFKTNDSNEMLIRNYDVKNIQPDGLTYLNSYDNVELDISENDTTFFATKSISLLNNVELLSLSSTNINDYFVSFEVTYIKDINIFFIKAKLNNSAMMIDQINIVGYPFFNNVLNRVDISFEYFGIEFLASDLLNDGIEQQAITNHFFLELNAGSGDSISVNITTPVLQISTAIINAGDTLIEDNINLLQDIVPVDFWEDGPLHYLLWYVKAEKAIDNYNHNKAQTVPINTLLGGTNYIDHQNLLSNWNFGFQSFDKNGCGVISLYNLLVSQGRTPNLASLILLNELLNADLGLGFLGLNPISNDLMIVLSNTVNTIFHLIYPLLITTTPIIAGIITAKLIEVELDASTKWWQDILIWASLPFQYVITLAAVETAINLAVAAIDLVIEFYLEHLHGIPDILSVLGYNSLDVAYLNYDSFNSGRLGYGYFILTTFNEVPNFTDASTLSAHTYFVKRDYVNQTSLTTYNMHYNPTSTSTNFYSLFSTYSDRNDQFISGITIKG